jgi:anti-sigma factor RsiW
MKDCIEVFEMLSEYLDDELPAGLCEEVALHLADCPQCEEAAGQLRRSIDMCRAYCSAEQPSPLPQDVKAQLLDSFWRVQQAMRAKV